MDTNTAVTEYWQAEHPDWWRAEHGEHAGMIHSWQFSSGIKYDNEPHPSSYRPDIPFGPGTVEGHATASLKAWADRIIRERVGTRTKREKQATTVKLNAPHPASYRPELPLSGSPGLLKLTKADREYYAAHPLGLEPHQFKNDEHERGHRMSPKGLEKARSMLAALNIREGQ